MATYLEICQATAFDCAAVPGAVSSDTPSTVTGQTGTLKAITQFVKDGWTEVQRSRARWRWLEQDFSASLISGTQEYTALSLGITSRFSKWLPFDREGELAFTVYPTGSKSDEQAIDYWDWHEFRRKLMRGATASDTGRPRIFTVDESQKVLVYPTPDAAYTLEGLYYKAPQTLAADSDTPECPSEFHDIIKYKALMKFAVWDEAMEQYPAWDMEYRKIHSALMHHQVPRIRRPAAFA